MTKLEKGMNSRVIGIMLKVDERVWLAVHHSFALSQFLSGRCEWKEYLQEHFYLVQAFQAILKLLRRSCTALQWSILTVERNLSDTI